MATKESQPGCDILQYVSKIQHNSILQLIQKNVWLRCSANSQTYISLDTGTAGKMHKTTAKQTTRLGRQFKREKYIGRE